MTLVSNSPNPEQNWQAHDPYLLNFIMFSIPKQFSPFSKSSSNKHKDGYSKPLNFSVRSSSHKGNIWQHLIRKLKAIQISCVLHCWMTRQKSFIPLHFESLHQIHCVNFYRIPCKYTIRPSTLCERGAHYVRSHIRLFHFEN